MHVNFFLLVLLINKIYIFGGPKKQLVLLKYVRTEFYIVDIRKSKIKTIRNVLEEK